MKNIIKFIENSKNVAVFAHVNPDPDALGSMIAFYHAMKDMGKNCSIFLNELPNEKFAFLNFKLFKLEDDFKEYDLAVALDSSDKKRVEQIEIFEKCKYKIAIDHHLIHDDFCDCDFVNSKASSCCEVLFSVFNELKIKFNKDIATALYLGLAGDTGCFLFDNTSAFTHYCASKLLEYGADLQLVNNKVFRTKKFNELVLLKEFISNIIVDENVGLGVILTKDKIKANCEDFDTTEFVNYIKEIEGIDIAILIKQVTRGEYKVSLRSSNNYDVSQLAHSFGGGGHKQASAFLIKMGLKKLKSCMITQAKKIRCNNEN